MDFIEFKKSMQLHINGFYDELEDWEIHFYLDRAKSLGMDEENILLLKQHLKRLKEVTKNGK